MGRAYKKLYCTGWNCTALSKLYESLQLWGDLYDIEKAIESYRVYIAATQKIQQRDSRNIELQDELQNPNHPKSSQNKSLVVRLGWLGRSSRSENGAKPLLFILFIIICINPKNCPRVVRWSVT